MPIFSENERFMLIGKSVPVMYAGLWCYTDSKICGKIFYLNGGRGSLWRLAVVSTRLKNQFSSCQVQKKSSALIILNLREQND
ncbi:hypothetical protein [Pedobacter miscanthi]|uniref:Uncharacterized protein n=1 Tax=Pedobacter miscanthi TaxID=2259170 RepID=A0A366KN87_9SPHI|nr:hypothetical protein [Pedobacter miscanthi]RBQ02958.1 hypothetical protein DRW42_23765 [Pedobacter miscanthi]